MSTDIGAGRQRKSSLPSLSESSPLKTRWILQPKESMTWKVEYYPTAVGESNETYAIEIPFWRYKYEIKCRGICDVPAIDMTPEILFEKVADSKPSNFIYPPTFFYSSSAFDFGAVIPTQL